MQVKEGKKITGPEQLKDAAFGCARIRGDTLGIVGLGTFHWSFCGSAMPIAKLSSSSPSSKPNSRVELVERSLHQQLDHELISDLLSWRPVPNFGISLHPPTSISTNFPNLQRRDSWPQIQCKLWFPKMSIFWTWSKKFLFYASPCPCASPIWISTSLKLVEQKQTIRVVKKTTTICNFSTPVKGGSFKDNTWWFCP